LSQDQLLVLPHEVERFLEPHQQILGVGGVLSRRDHASDKGRVPGMAFLGFHDMPVGTFKISLVKGFILSWVSKTINVHGQAYSGAA
jgi:hypothetical protein